MQDSRLDPAATFVGFALVAAAFQVLATLLLGLAPLDAIQRAAEEGSRLYLIGAFGTGVATVVLWVLRQRPLVASIAFLALELTLMLSLVTRTSRLGLAYHGEFILHHFCTLLAAAACVSLGWRWFRTPRFGARRWVAGAPALLGGAALLIVHAASQPSLDVRVPSWTLQASMGLALFAPALALGALWKDADASGTRVRWLAAVVQVPLLLRVAVGLPNSLSGAPVPDWARSLVMASVVVAAVLSFSLFRPQMPRPVRFVVIALSSFATAILYMVYVHPLGFGQLEDGLGGIAQSLFGFSLPYPTFVSGWKILGVCLAVFCIFSAVYGGLLSWDERLRGLALGLFAITGIGVSNPQLALMATAALLLVVHTLTEGEETAAPSSAGLPVEEILRDTADALGLPAPVVLEAAEGTMVSLRGDLDGTDLDLRARPTRGGGWRLSFRAGVIGRGRPLLELAPAAGDRGPRPAHELARTHRAVGDVRRLEAVDDAQLDALTPFSRANAKFWDAGIEVDLGSDLTGLDAPRLAALLSASTSAA